MTTDEIETKLREDLVTCTRLLVFCNILDYSGHVSARIPGTDRVLIQPRDKSRSALKPEDLVVVNLEDEVVQGDAPPPVEFPIHTGVYRARPDVGMVCHGHPRLSTTFSMTDVPLVPMRHFAYKHPKGLAIHPDPTHIVTRDQGDAVAKTLGDADACLLRSHGTVLAAERFDVLFMDCLDLEENAETLLAAKQLGGQIFPLTDDEVALLAESYGRSRHRPGKVWDNYIHRGKAAGLL